MSYEDSTKIAAGSETRLPEHEPLIVATVVDVASAPVASDVAPVSFDTLSPPYGGYGTHVGQSPPLLPDGFAPPPFERRAVPRRRRFWLPLGLFVATCLTTFSAPLFADIVPWPLHIINALVRGIPLAKIWPEIVTCVWLGAYYAAAVMTILVCHEMGHFLQARRYGVYASYPYFIPMPISPLGTMGAVIAMESRIGGRRALFDIGISGPLAGLVPTMIFLVVGLNYSQIGPQPPAHSGGEFGEPLVLTYLARLILGPVPEGSTIFIGPVAKAGWVGLLLTSLNLMPIGQLDGGHILYAMLRRRAHQIAWGLIGMTVAAMFLYRGPLLNWIPLVVLLLLMGPAHPPTANDDEPLGIGRYLLGAATLAFIIVGFTLEPLRM